jgi:hypothetical protein
MYMNKYNKTHKKKRYRKRKDKYQNATCNNKMTFQECEMAILRTAVDENELAMGRQNVNNEDVKKILKIVENFIVDKKLICYGGTAINNILPKEAQFYNKETDIPDYDFFSKNALEDSKELADIYYNNGYVDVEAKAGMHVGTYKVFVNFIPIADITQLDPKIYDSIQKETIIVAGIHYSPPNYLRMSMYLELSRPSGDISRWEKVFKRLTLLNKYYPMDVTECSQVDFQRKLDNNLDKSETIYIVTRDALINQGVVFFGGYSFGLYSRYAKHNKYILQEIPDFDVLSETPDRTAMIVKEQLTQNNIKKIKIIKHNPIGEIIPERYEIRVGLDTIAIVYKPIACHSYNKITINQKEVNIATIDTILSFYLSMIYVDIDLNYNRLLCMASFLFNIQEHNRLNQRGLLKRFSMSCYGKQLTLEDIRSEKADKYREFKDKKIIGKEYDMWFLKYNPSEQKKQKSKNKTKKNVSSPSSTKKPKPTILEILRGAKTH